MSKGLFIVGTDTDVGKTFVTGLLVKSLREQGVQCGYYKAVLSGGHHEGERLIPGDAKEVMAVSGLEEAYEKCVSYTLEHPVSPHLAARWEGVEIQLEKIVADYRALKMRYDYLMVEGSGGVICPIKLTDHEMILLEDLIRLIGLPVVVVARAGLGTINHTVLTVRYLDQMGIAIKGIILNGYEVGNEMHEENKRVIEKLTGIQIVATVTKYEVGEAVEGRIDGILEW